MEVLKGSDDSCVDSDGIQHEDETVLAVGEAGDITIAEEEGQSGDGESEWFMKNWPYEALGDDVVLMNALHDKPDELALAYTTVSNGLKSQNIELGSLTRQLAVWEPVTDREQVLGCCSDHPGALSNQAPIGCEARLCISVMTVMYPGERTSLDEDGLSEIYAATFYFLLLSDNRSFSTASSHEFSGPVAGC